MTCQPRPTLAVVALLGATAAGCAIGGAFTLTPQEQVAAEDWAISSRQVELALARAPHGPLERHSEWAGGDCRWTWKVDVAECRTASRPSADGAWVSTTRRYKYWSEGAWELLVP